MGANAAQSKDGLPLLMVVVLAPHDGAALEAVLDMQKDALGPHGAASGAIDVRYIAIPESQQQAERLREEMKNLVGDAWYQHGLRIDGTGEGPPSLPPSQGWS